MWYSFHRLNKLSESEKASRALARLQEELRAEQENEEPEGRKKTKLIITPKFAKGAAVWKNGKILEFKSVPHMAEELYDGSDNAISSIYSAIHGCRIKDDMLFWFGDKSGFEVALDNKNPGSGISVKLDGEWIYYNARSVLGKLLKVAYNLDFIIQRLEKMRVEYEVGRRLGVVESTLFQDQVIMDLSASVAVYVRKVRGLKI